MDGIEDIARKNGPLHATPLATPASVTVVSLYTQVLAESSCFFLFSQDSLLSAAVSRHVSDKCRCSFFPYCRLFLLLFHFPGFSFYISLITIINIIVTLLLLMLKMTISLVYFQIKS